MTRLSSHRFRSNEVRLMLNLIAYNLGNLWRRLVLPNKIENWSLTSLQQRLVKTGGRLVRHARYYWLMLAESHLTRRLFGSMVRRIEALPGGRRSAQRGGNLERKEAGKERFRENCWKQACCRFSFLCDGPKKPSAGTGPPSEGHSDQLRHGSEASGVYCWARDAQNGLRRHCWITPCAHRHSSTESDVRGQGRVPAW